jgi:PQQ enzyme repeat
MARCGRGSLAILLVASGAISAAPPRERPVLEHHGGPRRDGAYVDPGMTRAAAAGVRPDPAFHASVPGAIYAQPLFVPRGAGGRDVLVVASESNTVAALDAATGKAVWSRSLGAPVPGRVLPCGNIDPLGVTGTPAVDAAGRTVYLDALVRDAGGSAHHLVFALALDDGAVRPGWPVDVAAALERRGQRFEPRVQNQRGALALVSGWLYVPFGGHYGDCGDYRGWLVAIPVAHPTEVSAWSTGARGGGIWGPSGVASDAGQVFVATGNTMGARRWSGGEAVLRFPAGAPLATAPDAFAPADWRDLDDGDVDIGGTGPVLVDVSGATPSRLAVALGKNGKLYLLDRARLGGIGGALAEASVAEGSIITAAAAYTTARGTYVAFRGSGARCPGGRGSGDVASVRIAPGAPPRPELAWCARVKGRGSPMVTTTDGRSEAIVWIVGAEGDGKLHAFDGDTGEPIGGGVAVGGGVRRFQTPIAANGRIYVAVDGGVKAFVR